jgi:hypothetical protein
MKSVSQRGSEWLVVYLALLLASILTRRYRVTVLLHDTTGLDGYRFG